VWFMFLLLRQNSVSRPILAFIGAPGCLSADTPIRVKRGRHDRTYSIKEMFNRLQAGDHYEWDKATPTRVLSFKDGIVQWLSIKDVVKSGVKATYSIEVEGHK